VSLSKAWTSPGDRGGIYTEASDAAYAKAFHSYGFGRTDEAPEVVASRIRASNIRGALVDALDVWKVPLEKPDRKAWVLHVAREADRDQSAWVVLARNPKARRDRKQNRAMRGRRPTGHR
jgi:eukaryotic-like serine/threonine-protein kinase